MYPLEQDRPHGTFDQVRPYAPPAPYPGAGAPPPPPPPAARAQLPPAAARPPPPVSTVWNGRIYSLEVVQQPIRARMCGFGDKDRRPITPPPCVRLRVLDANTHKEIDVTEIDTSFFVLSVDLWNADGNREVNLVRHSATSPSISTASPSSFPPPAQIPQYPPYGHPSSMYGQPAAYPQYYAGQPAYGEPSMPYAPNPGQMYYPVAPGYYQSSQGMTPQSVLPPQLAPTQPTGMFTRNLIGSLSASAFKLTDPENKLGIWFILQDLSVRTEGAFRLKMNFVNVGTDPADPSSESSGPILNHGSAPVLASVFSDVFHVFSAKKFPGVIESTPLSKCFAIQGIKIPIRKDGVKGRGAAAIAALAKDRDGEGEEWDE
ncbi:Velvet complex subunit ryp3 [Coccidioides posadasii str. Silveira]|uniref:Developmental regulator VelB n=1 Tax=Coccidioides posadasii (strain RMSCC 757 / Silveira) TaxID=443226 RepID=E9DJR3_COCPS|nr:developmental regulator VelB [Coccidioides posadasii str. Silveira]QVM12430.1 Velvet complex subunit ryp3 [Coccidioides posadasii str. Silveira]